MQFLILHGSFGSAEGNWFPRLKERLENIGQEVVLPQFPVDSWEDITENGSKSPPKRQILSNWMDTFKKDVLPELDVSKGVCIVAHSLGPLFSLHIIEEFNLKLDSAIFVSPFLEKLGGDWQIDHVNKSFYKKDFDWKRLKKLIPLSYALYSDNDPYIDEKFAKDFSGRLGSRDIPLTGAGHMNSEVGLSDFSLVFELCKTRVDFKEYHK